MREMTPLLPLLVHLLSTLPQTALSLNSEGKALLSLAATTLHLPLSILSTWNSSHPTPCNTTTNNKWLGVGCSDPLHDHDHDHDHVTSLSLPSSHLHGPLGPSSSFSLLPNLQHLDLSSNSLSGELPSSLCNLTSLSFLSLFDNHLSGPLPPCLFLLPNLQTLYLNNNNLTGAIPTTTLGSMTKGLVLWLNDNLLTGPLPESITNCTNLAELYLSNNILTGSLPEGFGALSQLEHFDISGNALVGTIPSSLGNCSNLREVVLSHNRLDGAIPSELGNCTNLFALALLDNRLSGPIPPSFASLSNIQVLFLNENSLSGSIPPDLGNCTSLTWLQLHVNRLEGPIPRELGRARNLRRLTLFSNRLIGEVPTEIWRIGSLEEVLIYDNNLSGELPEEIAELVMLRNISLFNNNFSGPIPRGFGAKANLQQVDFTNNRFAGEIPDGICHGRQLRVLNLGSNLLSGSVPRGIGSCWSLKRLILSYNNLTGHLPELSENSSLLYVDVSSNHVGGILTSSLGNCKNLTTLRVSENAITGRIPGEIGNLAKLELLDLSSNDLVGEFPPQLSHCSKLSLLDLGGNRLSGSIPSTLWNLTLLTRLILRDNLFGGKLPDFLPKFGNLLELQLGGNTFGGSIPPSVGHVESLSIALNLSSNELTGEVPPDLGNLKMLQNLDLSLNDLTGSLLPLGSLVSLLKLNVSYNNFTGPIPDAWLKFLGSSTSSFRGNPGLCIPCGAGDASCCNRSSSKWHLPKLHLVLVIIGSLILLLMVIFIVGYVYLNVGYRKINEGEIEPSLQGGSTLLLNKVMEATENLSDRFVVGKGAHGTIYKASVSREKVYAVKKLEFARRKGSSKSMAREVKTLGKIRHRNLVKLVDFWMRREIGLIAYEYMPNGSLHEILHERKPPPRLDWSTRYRIVLGVAQGLAYLHHDCDPPIVHCDIKPKNILLDMDMEPHISDFGIAKLMDGCSSTAQSTAVVGTLGYMSPEIAFSMRRSKESDVYSYGVVVLELITRREALGPSYPENAGLVSWVMAALDNASDDDAFGGVVDVELLHDLLESSELEEVRAVLALALRCTAKAPTARPSMRDVVKELTGVKSRKN